MAKILTPNQVVDAFAKAGKTTTLNTLRRWRRDGNVHTPPWTFEGKKPRYRSDLLHAGTYAVGGYLETFPPPKGKTAILETTEMGDPDTMALEAVLAKAEADGRMWELEEGDELFIVVDDEDGELNASDPATRKVLGTLAKMARGSR